ncbi:MAG: ATP phosphoribosyltransferase regulatory subunit, partial [Tardiphaga sp.]
RLIVLRAFDKLDRLGMDGLRLLLGSGRKDESGDFTKGAELQSKQIDRLIEFLEMGAQASQDIAAGKGSEFLLPQNLDQDAFLIPKEGSFYVSDLPPEKNPAIDGWEELNQIRGLTRSAGYGIDRIRIDPSVVRGLEYYTGPVYEVELLLETKDEKGRPVRFGSVGGGGRYDGLVSRFRGQPVPATGFSIGVSRLQAALTMIGKLDTKPAPGPVLVIVFRDGETADYQKLVSTLRNAGIRAELYLGSTNHNLGQQLRYADRRGSPCAVIQGSDEKAKRKVLVRDLIAGAELAKLEQSNREAYLKRQAEAQHEADEDKLVDAVRNVLAHHRVSWN